jgi:hypothetical protein
MNSPLFWVLAQGDALRVDEARRVNIWDFVEGLERILEKVGAR